MTTRTDETPPPSAAAIVIAVLIVAVFIAGFLAGAAHTAWTPTTYRF